MFWLLLLLLLLLLRLLFSMRSWRCFGWDSVVDCVVGVVVFVGFGIVAVLAADAWRWWWFCC